MQRRIGVEPDGVIGPVTLTRLEALVDAALAAPSAAPTAGASLTVSTKGVDALMAFEVGSEAT